MQFPSVRSAAESASGAVSGAAAGRPGEDVPPPFPIIGNTASTFLTHFFGSGLADDRYVVKRFKALACGDIRPVAGEKPATTKKSKRRVRDRKGATPDPRRREA